MIRREIAKYLKSKYPKLTYFETPTYFNLSKQYNIPGYVVVYYYEYCNDFKYRDSIGNYLQVDLNDPDIIKKLELACERFLSE